MSINVKALKQRVQELTVNTLPFMEGKELMELKGDLFNHILTVDDYGYLEGENGEFIVITTKEYPSHFFFGSSVITEAFKKLDNEFTADELKAILDDEEGLTFKVEEKVSKNKRKYKNITFFPN